MRTLPYIAALALLASSNAMYTQVTPAMAKESLVEAIEQGFSTKYVSKLLRQHPFLGTAKINQEEQTALHLAAKYKRAKIAKVLMRYKPNVNAQDEQRKTALHYAAAKNDNSMVYLLLNNKASAIITDNAGNKPEHYASGNIKKQLVVRRAIEHQKKYPELYPKAKKRSKKASAAANKLRRKKKQKN